MTINATLFAQFFNFVVAYFLIRLILLKPAVEVINKEDNYIEGLSKELDSKKAELEKKAQEMNNLRVKAQKNFKLSWPDIVNQRRAFIVEYSKGSEMSEREINKLADTISKATFKKILDV